MPQELRLAGITTVDGANTFLRERYIREFNEKSWQIPEKHLPYRYTLAAHGVGLADEWPIIPLHTDFQTACSGQFEPGMVICVESLVGEAGSESVKLESQVLVTETGHRRLDGFPWEET